MWYLKKLNSQTQRTESWLQRVGPDAWSKRGMRKKGCKVSDRRKKT
jgi:hypothetical protein